VKAIKTGDEVSPFFRSRSVELDSELSSEVHLGSSYIVPKEFGELDGGVHFLHRGLELLEVN